MSSAHIVANQAGLAAGQPSISRRDLALGVPVFLKNSDDDGVRSYRWRMVDRPSGSAAVIANKASAVSQFTPDVPGSYLVELQVDDAREGQVDRRVFAVLTDFGGLSPRPLRIPASGEDDEANWKYDFGVTTAANARGWMPDFVELILYAGLLNGPAAALATVLLSGQVTGGRDIILSTGDAVRGETDAAVVGGAGVTGGSALLAGADSIGPNGDGGDATVRVGQGAGAGVDGALALEGALAATVTLAAGNVTVAAPSGGFTTSSLTASVTTAGNTALVVGNDLGVLVGGDSSTSVTGAVGETCVGAWTRSANTIADAAAASLSLTSGADTTLDVGNDLHISVTGAVEEQSLGAWLRSGDSITDVAETDVVITATTGQVALNATANINLTAGTFISISATQDVVIEGINGDATLTSSVNTTVSGEAVALNATSAIGVVAGTDLSETATGTITRVSAGDRTRSTSTPATDYVERKTIRLGAQAVPGATTITVATVATIAANGRQSTVKVTIWAADALAASVVSWRGDFTFYRAAGTVVAMTAHQDSTIRVGGAGTIGQVLTFSLLVSGDDVLLRCANSGAGLLGNFTGVVETQAGGA